MFSLIVNIVGPVFLLVFVGFIVVKFCILSDNAIDGVMGFATHIAVPCLLFRATSTINLSTAYDWRLLVAYFGTAGVCFGLACFSSQQYYGRRPGQAVAVGFTSLYSNLLLIGAPIIDRAFGQEALVYAFALVSLNAPICYLAGITVMEKVRADGRSTADTASVIVKTTLKNSLMIGILLGLSVNLIGLELPIILTDCVDMLKSAALPCALFALGGVLTRYSLSNSLHEASMLSVISLALQPVMAYVVCTLLGLNELHRDVVVLMSAMPVGLNAFLFANFYSRGIATAANTVLLSTIVSIISISAWLWFLV